jgi:hypothetical protein
LARKIAVGVGIGVAVTIGNRLGNISHAISSATAIASPIPTPISITPAKERRVVTFPAPAIDSRAEAKDYLKVGGSLGVAMNGLRSNP